MRNRNLSTLILSRPFDTSRIKLRSPYVCLLYANEHASNEEIKAISPWIVSSGCRYAVCAGLDCSEWHDAIDMADIAGDPSLKTMIMTSWHINEPLEDVVWFWLNCTDYDDSMFDNYLVLIVGNPIDVETRIMQAASQAEPH